MMNPSPQPYTMSDIEALRVRSDKFRKQKALAEAIGVPERRYSFWKKYPAKIPLGMANKCLAVLNAEQDK